MPTSRLLSTEHMGKIAQTFKELFANEDFLSDVETVNTIPDEELATIVQDLARIEPSMPAVLATLDRLPESSQRRALLKTVFNFSRIFADQTDEKRAEEIAEIVKLAPSAVDENPRAAQALNAFGQKLPLLIVRLNAIRLLQRATDYVQQIGNRVLEFACTSELRPLFTDVEISGLVPIVNLRFAYTSDDDDHRNVLELRLSEVDLDMMQEGLSKLKRRLALLRADKAMKVVDLQYVPAEDDQP